VSLLLRAGLRQHVRHPLQSVLLLLGIAAGVALLVAVQSAQRSAERAFDQALATVAGHATHTVTAGPDGIPVARYAALVAELGARRAAPSVQALARATGRTERTVLRVLGTDPLADVALRPWAAPGARAGAPVPVAELLTQPGTFVATAALLQRLELQRGSALPLSIGGRPVVARCLGVLEVEDAVAKGLDDLLLVDIATAQEWTGRPDRIDRIDLRLDDRSDVPRALAAVRTQLGPGVRIAPAGMHQGGLAQLARGFRVNLTALSLLSLLVGAFLVHETMRLSVVARRPQFGVLRALGVPGSRLGRAVAGEALALGLCGSGLGALLGTLAANVLLAPLVRTLNDHYATFSLQRVDFDPWLVLACVALGGGVAMLAGLGPAVAAARITARDVLVPARAPASGRRSPWPVLGRVVLPAVAAVVLLATVGDRVVQGYLGVLAVVLAAVAAVPTAMDWFLAAWGRALAPLGPFARYVVRSTAAARTHLALPVAAMALALAATVGLATLVGSFRDSVAGWLGQVLPGDVFVSVPGGVDERTQPILPEVAAAMQAAPGIAAATVYHRTVLPVRGGPGAADEEIDVVGVAPTAAFSAAFPLLGSDSPRGRGAIAANTGAWVSEPLAFRRGLAAGDVLTVTTARGPVPLPIAAIYRDYSNERGEVIVGAAWLAAHANAPVTAFGFEVAPGADVAAVVADVRARAAAAGDQAVQVRAQRELRLLSLQIFDRTFAITGAMRILCLLVACIGIYAAFAALQLERGGEIGLLRCLGARPARIGAVVIGQTALLGLCAGVLSLPFGALLGHLLAWVINRISFGWTLVEVDVPASALGEALLLAVAAAVLAGLQPAWRFARMRPAEALREA
jgi:putative ABC transport system permease protein